MCYLCSNVEREVSRSLFFKIILRQIRLGLLLSFLKKLKKHSKTLQEQIIGFQAPTLSIKIA